jgi:hypothetical protein
MGNITTPAIPTSSPRHYKCNLKLQGTEPNGTRTVGALTCGAVNAPLPRPSDKAANSSIDPSEQLLQVALHTGYTKSGHLNITLSGMVKAVDAALCQEQMEYGREGSADGSFPQALLYFCGSDDVIEFEKVSVVNVMLASVALNADLPGTTSLSADPVAALNDSSIASYIQTSVLGFAGGVKAVFRGARFETNWGPAMGIAGGATVWLTDQSRVQGHRGSTDGGAVSVWGNASVVLTGASNITRNQAEQMGGGVYVGGPHGRLWVDGQAVISNNSVQNDTALNLETTTYYTLGGGIAGAGNARIIITGGSVLSGNVAGNIGSGGAFSVTDQAAVMITGKSKITGNYATEYGGGGYAESNSVFYVLNATSVSENTAGVLEDTPGLGGGIAAPFGNARIYMAGANVEHNSATGGDGGGLYLSENVTCIVNDTRIAGNSADQGGGISLEFYTEFLVTGNSVITNNTAADGLGGGVFVCGCLKGGDLIIDPNVQLSGNHAKKGGGNMWLDPESIDLQGPEEIEGFASRLPRDLGVIDTTVRLHGFKNVSVEGALVAATWNGLELLGGVQPTNANGFAHFPDLKLRGPPGLYTIQVTAPFFPDLVPVNFTVHVRGCQPGEVTNNAGDVCEPCPEGS